MKSLSRGVSLLIISCLMLFQPVQSVSPAQPAASINARDFTRDFIREFTSMPQYELTQFTRRWLEVWQIAENDNPSAFTKIGHSVGNVVRGIHDHCGDIFTKAINAGKSAAEARAEVAKAIGQMTVATAGTLGTCAKSFCNEAGFLRLPLVLIGLYGAKVGFDFAKEYYIMRFKRPQLLRSTVAPYHITKNLDDLLYTGQTNKQITTAIKIAKSVVENKKTGLLYKINPLRDTSKGRARFENLMLWGPPGTGKTAIVEVLAKEAGMTLFTTTGGDFAKLKGKDLQQIDELFKNARASSRPVLLFIDEMEKLFGSRTNMSEDSRQVFTKLLAELSNPSNQIMLVGATNRPEDLDEAIYRRLPTQIQVAYPDQAGRINLFGLYKKLLFEKDTMYSKAQLEVINKIFCPEKIEQIERIMGKISPADIATVMSSIKNRSLAYNQGIPTETIINEVLFEKQKQFQTIKDGFKRIDTDILTSKDTH